MRFAIRSPFGLPVYVTACQSVPFSLDHETTLITLPNLNDSAVGRVVDNAHLVVGDDIAECWCYAGQRSIKSNGVEQPFWEGVNGVCDIRSASRLSL